MSAQENRIAWFIALSVAIHAAALLVGNRAVTSLGRAGEVLQVSMTQRAVATGAASPVARPAGQFRAQREPPRRTDQPTLAKPAGKPLMRLPDRQPPGTGEGQSVDAPHPGDAEDPGQAAPASGSTDTHQQTAEHHLRKRILELVTGRLDYPVLARRKGWQGIVKLEVHIESDGRISRLRVEETSGYPVLDRAALRSLQLASVPDAEQWMKGRAIDIIIPVEYRLVGG